MPCLWVAEEMIQTFPRDPSFKKCMRLLWFVSSWLYSWSKKSDAFWLADRIRLFVYNIISLSALCKLIWRHWTFKMAVRYILSSVWVRLSTFSQLCIIQYMGLCVFSLPISLVMIERIYTVSCYHHQIASMNYYPLFRVRSWNNGVRCMSFIFLWEYFVDSVNHPPVLPTPAIVLCQISHA